MADSYSEPGVFEGADPKECEAFVATVRRRGLEQGKHRDNEWMAVFASSYLGGDALYWYEDLEEDVQNDWSRLRPALLARFGRRGKNPSVTPSAPTISGSTPSTTIPTPAAAPPATIFPPMVRKGRLKVLDSNRKFHGYVAKSANEQGLYCLLSSAPDPALLVSFSAAVDGPFGIQVIDASQNPQVIDILAIAWSSLSGGTWMEKSEYVASLCSFSNVTSKTSWAVEQKVWKISKDGELSAEYPKPDGSAERLQPRKIITQERIWWYRPPAPSDHHAIIVFEDAI
ncbi:glycoside hydrolase family 13 protein [Tulasnella calospora MUT 4182]|uniref:Glycoside hydrolase family 13 protein n=1 Tax=Tulasnella calospora MUT 4182 TaxID=1051891 RepID=A0A0C3LAY5_9AGAM|nr:glycoside hydrolase family 13 protein [Tulasnella calospora MUT 4182]